MAEPLPTWLRVYCKLTSASSAGMHTLLARLKYWPFISMGPNCSIQRDVTIRQLLFRSSRLRVVLKGHNKIGHHSHLQGSGTITFGPRSFCGAFCVFGVNDRIEIGSDVMIAQAVSVRDSDHIFTDPNKTIVSQGLDIRPVVINDDVWLGHGVTVLKGVTVGRGAVVAAGAVVTRDVEPYTVVGGVPARMISRRGNDL